jgi:ferritin
MISKKMQEAINEQINKELFSEFLYLSMAAWFEAKNLPGFANFFYIQAKEERFHAMKLYHFLLDRGGKVVLKGIADPQVDFAGTMQVFETSYKHELGVTASIHALVSTAVKEKDLAAQTFLNWFVDEQVEEEKTQEDVLNQLKLFNGEGAGLLFLDRELATRTFIAPAPLRGI